MTERGRPSDYREEYNEQARKLCLFGATDDAVAWFFDIDLPTLAVWAWESEAFYNAITPTDDERAAYRAKVDTRRSARAAWRKVHRRSPGVRLENNARSRIWLMLKNGERRDRGLVSRLGYSIDELRNHLESRFLIGMSWENYGKWHVDHIRPCSLFDMRDRSQFHACWALANLQPLWAADNIRKGAKYASAAG
jgi:hypothetical protein